MNFFNHISGGIFLMIKGMFSRPENGKMYWKEFMHQCTEIGIGSLGIVVSFQFSWVRCQRCKLLIN